MSDISFRAIRGATTLEQDSASEVERKVQELLLEILDRNQVSHDDVVSVIFTSTPDISSAFPATAARGIGFGDVPLLGASEADVKGGTPLCIRVLLHVTTQKTRSELRHVYLHGARGLRDDLPS